MLVPARPPSDQQFVHSARVGQAANGVAGQPKLAGDGSQPNSLLEQGVNSRVPFTHTVRRPSRLPRLGHASN